MSKLVYAVLCRGDVLDEPCNKGQSIQLTEEQYMSQLSKANKRWKCPMCRGNAAFDDLAYEASIAAFEKKQETT